MSKVKTKPLNGNTLFSYVFVCFLIFISPVILIAHNSDSLWAVFNDSEEKIENRLSALYDITWRVLFRDPDSAFVLAGMLEHSAIENEKPESQASAYKIMGISHKLRGDYTASLELYNKGLELTIEHGLLETMSSIYVNMGLSYKSMGEYELAEEAYVKAIEIQELNGFSNLLRHSYNNLGVLYIIQHNVPLSLEYFQKAIKVNEHLNDLDRMATGYQNIGLVYREQKEFDIALQYLERSLTLFHELGDQRREAHTYNNIGIIYKDIDSLDKAETYYLKGLAISKELNDKENMAALYINLGNVYRIKDIYQKAFDYFKKSLEVSTLLKNKRFITEALNGMGTTKNLQHQFISGENYCKDAYRIAEEIGYLEELKNSCDCLTRSYDGQGDVNLAFKYYKEYHVYIDSIETLANADEVIKMTMQYEFEKRHLADSLVMVEDKLKTELAYQQELNTEKTRRNILLTGGLVIFVLAAGLLGRLFLVRRTNRKLAEKNRIIHREKQRAEESEKAKEQFFDNISHEFRTPLTLILGPIEEMHAKVTDEELKPKLGIMERNALRLQTMINELLSLSKLESGKVILLAKEENISQLIGDYLSSFESLAKQKNIQIDFKAKANDIKAFVDAEKIRKVLSNLLSNAFKFTPDGGRISISIEEIDAHPNASTNRILIQVKDTGVGIPKEKLEHIFDRFYQVDGSHKRSYEGTGIGLALTKELVELHKGTITVESNSGDGTTFRILLMTDRDHLSDNQIIEDIPEVVRIKETTVLLPDESMLAHKTEGTKEKKTELPQVLIVEDNIDMRIYIKGHLDKLYNIHEAGDGEEGFEVATKVIPDLIISDIMMPKMDGTEMSVKVKNDIRTSHIPIILLTARSSIDSRIEGLETGVDDYLSKPFNARELLVRIKNLIDQRNKLKELFLQFAGNPEQAIFDNPSEANLSSKEEKFIKRAYEVVEEHMADPEFDVEFFAREMALSRVQLHRKIKGVTAQSARDFIRIVRLKNAARLLSKGSGNVTEVAYESGFNNLSWFTKIFRDQFGVSPSDYIKGPKQL